MTWQPFSNPSLREEQTPLERLHALWNQSENKAFRKTVGAALRRARQQRYTYRSARWFCAHVLAKNPGTGKPYSGQGLCNIETGAKDLGLGLLAQLLTALDLKAEDLVALYGKEAPCVSQVGLATEPVQLPAVPEPTDVILLARMIAAFLSIPEATQFSVMRMVEEEAEKYR